MCKLYSKKARQKQDHIDWNRFCIEFNDTPYMRNLLSKIQLKTHVSTRATMQSGFPL